eukprot:SAG25_NODE_222_length_11605_cov_6.982357_13_plen_106_part_00
MSRGHLATRSWARMAYAIAIGDRQLTGRAQSCTPPICRRNGPSIRTRFDLLLGDLQASLGCHSVDQDTEPQSRHLRLCHAATDVCFSSVCKLAKVQLRLDIRPAT